MSSTSIPKTFCGYGAKDQTAGKAYELSKIEYTPKVFNDLDVTIKISHCGICGSDLHVLSDGWPSPTSYHAIVGHEIVGEVVRAGPTSGHKVGSRVGVGAQAGSCLNCSYCDEGKEQFCDSGMIGTYQGKWEDGSIAQGGYADFTTVRGRFAIPIPAGLDSASVAPLLCAGVTTYSPLKRFHAGPGKRVGIVGIGGLGHLGLQWSNALGADTYALSHSDSKLADAKKLGVKPENFLITKDVKALLAKHARSFDIIICTSFQADLPLESLYFKLLRPEGVIVLCGLPEEKIAGFFAHMLVGKAISLAGSIIGGTEQIKEMLDLAVEKNIKAWVEVRPMSDATAAVKDMEAGKARYRYVLENPQ